MRQWFMMKKAEDNTAEISIYDEIGRSFWDDSAVSAKDFVANLAALGDVENISLRINSPGGDVFDGLAIHNALKNHKAKVTAHIDGIAASIASYIAMAADKIVMPANTFMLVHQASGFGMGTADDMQALSEDLGRIDKSITATYAARSGSTAAKVRALMKEDRLMDAKEAKEMGFVDEVTAETKMAAKFPLRLLPKAAADRFRAESGVEEPPAPKPAEPVQHPEPAPQPVPQPDPPAPQPHASNVVDIKGAKQQGVEEHRAYVTAITDLCTLARAADRIAGFLRDNTPVDKARASLLEWQAREDLIRPQNPGPQPVAASWSKITDKINARQKK